jgi:hypothetical protein
MPWQIRSVLAVLAGIVIGSAVNMGLIALGPLLISPPVGVDVGNAESLSRAIHLFEPQHFITPFLAHAVGTLAGALAAFLIAVRYKSHGAYAIGGFYLLGGVAASFMIPAPAWFIVLDLLVAYLPMAWLAIRIGARLEDGLATRRKSVA